MKCFILIVSGLLLHVGGMAQLPAVSSGTLQRLADFRSRFVASRNVDVWFPDGYTNKKRYPVVYVHDGQMLFDAATTWNKQEWKIDETAGKLITNGTIKECIIVGIWNNGEYRNSEYYPQKTLDSLSVETRDFIVKSSLKGAPRSDDYLKFIVEELKPHIDREFSTKRDRKNTFIMGSSMGGLISIYAICEYPEIFGGAAGISTHLPLTTDPQTPNLDSVAASWRSYLEKHLPKADTRKIYFDYGDQTLDALYPPLQKKVDEVMKAVGYTSKSWMTRYFPGEDHSEWAWAKRVDIPLVFFLAKK